MIIPLIITIALAEYAARDDFEQIGKDDKIRHGIQWLFRASVVTLACWLSGTWWLAIGLAGLFSAMFRWRLNTLRGLDWRYVSPSNWYDYFWMCVYVMKPSYFTRKGMSHARQFHANYYPFYEWQSHLKGDPFERIIHRAGTLAYIFEALLFVCVVVLYLRSL